MKRYPHSIVFRWLFFLLFMLSLQGFPQAPTFQLSYTSGVISASYSAEELMDKSGYFLCGEADNWKYGLVKTDERGKVKWAKRFSSATGQEYPYCTRQLTDSGFIMMGIDENNGFGPKAQYLYLVKADKSGNLQWAKTYDVPGSDRVIVTSYEPQLSPTILQTTGGGLAFAVTFLYGSGSAMCLFKTDVNGNLLWAKKYNVSGGGPLQETKDKGFILAGTSTVGTGDACLIKTDSNGVVQWSKTYGIAITPDIPYCVIQAKDKGYVISGYRGDWTASTHDMMIYKTDSVGNLQWEKIMGNAGYHDETKGVVQDRDDNFVVTGFYDSRIVGRILYDTYLTKISPSGNIFWQRIMDPSASEDRGTWVSQASSGNYVIAGATFTSMQLTVTDTSGIAKAGCHEANVTLPLVLPTLTVVNPLSATATNITSTIIVVDQTSATVTGDFPVQRNVICINCNLTISPGLTVCPGNSVTLTAGGSSSYYWSTSTGSSPSPSIGPVVSHAPSVTTVYTVVELDCFSQISTTVTVGNPVLLTTPNSSMCDGFSYVLSATGALNYTWTPAASLNTSTGNIVNASPTSSTTYTIIGTAAGGCGDTATIKLTVNPLPVLSGNFNTSVCAGSWATLTTTGAVSYLWNTGSTSSSITIAPTASGSYTVTGTDNNGCVADAVASVSVNPIPQVIASPNTTICVGDVTTLSAGGTINYLWSNGASTSSTIVSPTSNNNYQVTGTDANGCSDTVTVNVTVSPKPVASISGLNNVCSGNNVILTAAQGAIYQWNNGQSAAVISVNPTSDSNYFVTVFNGSCFDTASFFVIVNSLPTILVSSDTGICLGNTVGLNVNGNAINYTWQPGSLSGTSIAINPSSTISYSVIGTDNNGCSNFAVTDVTVFPLPALITNSNVSICEGGSTSLSVTGASSYVWSNGLSVSSINVSPTNTSTYVVKGITQMGCVDSSQIIVTVNPSPQITASNDTSICEGERVILNASGASNYSWSSGQNTSAINVSPNISTSYTVTATEGGCNDTAVVSISVVPIPIANAGASVTILENTSTTLQASGGGAYQWTPSTGLSCVTCADPVANPGVTTIYYVTVTDETGCSSIDSMIVYVEEFCGDIFIPNAFSPNADGQNDNFMVMGSCIKTIYLAIYDRWGEKIFETNDIANAWDGTFRGEMLDTDVFSYKAVVTRLNDETMVKSANVSLIR